MNDDAFRALLTPEHFQVFVFSSPALFPFNFALHTWLVTAHHGNVSRFDVLYHRGLGGVSHGHLHRDILPPTVGLEKTFFCSLHWDSTLVMRYEGDADSETARLVHFLEEEVLTAYPYAERYMPLGPNSNTFTHWVLARFLPNTTSLPRRAIGQHWHDSR